MYLESWDTLYIFNIIWIDKTIYNHIKLPDQKHNINYSFLKAMDRLNHISFVITTSACKVIQKLINSTNAWRMKKSVS